MKARLSFVRRPSAKPEPLSPKGTRGEQVAEDDGPPMPEPLANPTEPRPSALGLPGRETQVPTNFEGATSPTMKGRSKSIMDLKKKQSTLSDGGGAEELGEDGVTRQIFPTSVREGFLKKKGVVNPTWKKRYIVLSPHQLAYYNEQPSSADAVPKGFIPLGSILKCEHHDHKDSLTDFKFDVTTPTRVFQLQADTIAEMDAWVASISGTAANEQQILASRKRNVSHAAIRTLTEEDRLRADESITISHELAELRQWPAWNPFEVAAWIQTFGMGRYSSEFFHANINGEKLKSLDDATLNKIGIEDKGDRSKILANVKKLNQESKRG